jgi:hypothetical protein
VVVAARFLSTSFASAAALAAITAAAAPSQPTTTAPAPQNSAAELLDAQATTLMQQRRFAEACPKLAESDRIQPGTGVLLRLALCYEQLGRTASAWSAFREAAGRARRAADAAVADLASKRADELEPRLAKLDVRLAPGDDPGPVDVRLDGAALASSTLGVDVPVDPGTHTVRASAPGRRSFERTFTVADRRATTTIAIELPVDTRGATQRTVAVVVASVGLAGVAAGGVLGLVAMSNWNRARSECNNGTSGCNQDALALKSTVDAEALASTIAFGVGAAGLAGAALLWWTAPAPAATRRATLVVSPAIAGGLWALDVRGTF